MIVHTGTKACGCMVAIMTDDLPRDYINQTLKEWQKEKLIVRLMDLEEARSKLRICNCQSKLDSKDKQKGTDGGKDGIK